MDDAQRFQLHGVDSKLAEDRVAIVIKVSFSRKRMKIDLGNDYNNSELFVIFTDGACLGNPGPGGWGCVIAWPNQCVQEYGGREADTTNNRMELKALITALDRLNQRQAEFLSTRRVKVFSDSSYVLNGVQKWLQGWKSRGWKTVEGKPVANPDLWQKLDELVYQSGFLRRFSVEWIWVRGHADIPGNERCDQIATQLAQGTTVDFFDGPMNSYFVDPLLSWESPEEEAVYAKPVYLSLVDGVLQKHSQWSDCERRVKGRSGVKYRKAMSREEEKKILKEWGVEDLR